MIDIVVDVLQALYLDYETGRGCFWEPDMEWDVTTIDEVAAVFRNHGLIFPTELPGQQE